MMILFLPGIQYYCPAWDKVYEKDEFDTVIENSKEMLLRMKKAVLQVEEEFPGLSDEDKVIEVLKRVNMLMFLGNKLVAKSIEACGNIKNGKEL